VLPRLSDALAAILLPTHPNKEIPEPWLSFLRELDSAVNEDIRLDRMGGFVISMVYGFPRPPGDLDVFEMAPRKPADRC
jgi:hypothetical protein